MALAIDRIIDLTDADQNPNPKLVRQLSIIHESSDGELVQYYIDPASKMQGDKNTHAIGVYNESTKRYTYTDYPDVTWNLPKQRIYGGVIERLGVKAFPQVGAFAFYKMLHRKISRVVLPVNQKDKGTEAPTLSAVVNPDDTITFTITPPSKPEYVCYRIIMQCDIISEEHITYDLVVTVNKPQVSGQYACMAIGYSEEGQLYSKDSNVILLSLAGENYSYVRPYYSKAEMDSMGMLDIDYLSRQMALVLSYIGAADPWIDRDTLNGEVVYIIDRDGNNMVFRTIPDLLAVR